ncbi:YlbF family regulator [Ornithinibacillus halotolerans]|uniref:Regulatory protein YlbF n=1 Tax=Ornithinibacillus halotolerans TaxID=1274357 RepID=A0A916WBQ8_9BACI|nr:YlbF family regulator [Ornithinibacillus halotolerans]GGA83753.1 regulatory protein YlbF [Ornithinibacillus halotolerans]
MIATLEFVEILDKSELLAEMVLNSEVYEEFQNAKLAMDTDLEAQRLIREFAAVKEHYEDVQRFGRYHPDYSEIMKSVRVKKRAMDLNDKVATYKIAERKFQGLLDEISQYIAFSVSDQIKVPKDGAALTDHGCGHGGACGCNAS